ncbi:uncharacterized protein [Sinocyclocheilus grahami]|uniref:uncharacterized protein n=1 Tax=Sinocyclocheilus grahami TaxID=75366 RepID=UPI0007AC96F0|nr:PREDICTED: uncharacterized protein LOC107563874 [Sinocyclocheilus grahami]
MTYMRAVSGSICSARFSKQIGERHANVKALEMYKEARLFSEVGGALLLGFACPQRIHGSQHPSGKKRWKPAPCNVAILRRITMAPFSVLIAAQKQNDRPMKNLFEISPGTERLAEQSILERRRQDFNAWGFKLLLMLEKSGTSNTDQLSVKDSGKGDSDFNDSDSDISGAAQKRGLTTFQPVARGAFNSAGDWKSKAHFTQTRNMHIPPGSAYTIGFAPAPLYNTTHVTPRSWRDSHSKTNMLNAQTFSRTGTLPSYSAHHTGVEEQIVTVKDAFLVSDSSEVATTF